MAHVEYAGGTSLARINESRAAVLARAPKWWRDAAERNYRQSLSAPQRPSATLTAKPAAARRWVGWVAGCIAPGISRPGYSKSDGERVPEMFTMRAWEGVMRQVSKSSARVRITWDHEGPTVATGLDALTFKLDRFAGLQFQARLLDSSLSRQVLAALGTSGLACSIGYVPVKQKIETQRGIGRVRIVDECFLDHVAILPPSSTLAPVFAAARCFGVAGRQIACPQKLLARAEQFAAPLLLRQVVDKV